MILYIALGWGFMLPQPWKLKVLSCGLWQCGGYQD